MATKQLSSLDTGVHLQVLTGQDNYNAWVRDFKIVAKSEGVWGFYQGTEPILTKPERADYHIPTQKKKRMTADAEIVASDSSSSQAPTTPAALNTLETNITQYKLDSEEWKDNDKKVRRAQTLLPQWVDPAIRGNLEEHENPKDAWEYLKAQYKMTNARALDIALTKMGRLKLEDCKSMQHYLNQHELLKLDITDAKGSYDDSQLISKIFRGLPFRYNNFVDQYHLLNEDHDVKLRDITTKLLTYESKLLERDEEKRANKADKDKKGSKGDDKGNDKNKKTCTYQPCGKIGHLEEECRMKQRHLENDKKAQNKAKTENTNDEKPKTNGHRQIVAMVNNIDIKKVQLAIQNNPKSDAKTSDINKFHEYIDDAFRGTPSVGLKHPEESAIQKAVSAQLQSELELAASISLPQEDDEEIINSGEIFARLDLQDAFLQYQTPNEGLNEQSETTDNVTNHVPNVSPRVMTRHSDDAQTTSTGTRTLPSSLTQANLPPQNECGKRQEGGVQGGAAERVPPVDDRSMRYQIEQNEPKVPLNVSRALVCASGPSKDAWIVDTGAVTHIANSKASFFKLHSTQQTIGTAEENATLTIEGAGSVKLTMTVQGQAPVDFSLSEAAYAPHSSCNLLSLQMLATKADMHGTWDKDRITILTSDNELVGQAFLKNGMYYIQTSEKAASGDNLPMVAATIDFDDPVWKWHRKLGHLSWENMRRLLKQSEGISVTDKQIKAKIKAVCPVCATTKALVRIPRDPARRHFKKLGELLIFDTWGPYPIISTGEVRYVMFATDDATRGTWEECFSRKDEIPNVLKRICKKIEHTHDVTVRRIRFDNEFMTGEIRHFVEKLGISIEPTAPYAHHQVGTQERANRTIREKAASMVQELSLPAQITKIITERGQEMLRSTSIPETLWPEAIKHAVWLKNRSPTKAHKYKKTPFEAIEGIKPDLSRDRIWGSRAYVTIPPETRPGNPKLHTPRGWLGYFVGCENESIYRIWNPDQGKVVRISAARIDDGEGQEHSHDQSSLADRIPQLVPQNNEDHNDNSSSTDISSTISQNSSDSEDEDQQEDYGTEGAESDHSPQPINDEDSPDEDTSDEEVVTSKYFDTKSEARADARAMATVGVSDDISNKDATPQNPNSLTTDPSRILRRPQTKDKSTKCQGCLQNQRRCDGNRPCSTCLKIKRRCKDQTDQTEEYVKQKNKKKTPNFIGRVPDDTKCDFCMKAQRRCDGKRPCSTCIQRQMSCKEQTEATKDLIPEENRHLLPVPKIADKAQLPIYTACQNCKIRRSRCAEERPCPSCIKYGFKCEPCAPTEKRVPLEDKCRRCRSRGFRCNGESPCGNCQTAGKICVQFEAKKEPKCGQCGGDGLACNRGRPCSSCIKNGHVCAYVDADGLVRRFYNLPEEEDIPSDEDECLTCRNKKRNCSGTEPCYRCVKHGEPVCTYRKAGRSKEIYYAKRFSLNETDGVVLNEDFEPAPKGAKKRKYKAASPATKDNESSDSPIEESEDDDLDEDINPAKKQRENPPLVATAQPRRITHEPQTYKAAMRLPDAKYYKEATEDEMQSILTNNVFELVTLPKGRHAITARWVFKKKMGADGQVLKYKARLVGKGFQQHEGLDFKETYSGVVKPTSYRILFALTAIFGWVSHQMDVKTAFLNADIEEELYVKPPPPYTLQDGKAWRMLRALYGFKQSPRAWYTKLEAELQKLGFRSSNFDQCVFIHKEELLIIAVHVDDIRLFSKTSLTIDKFKLKISKVFKMTDEGEGTCYLGIHVEVNQNTVKLHQSTYVAKILDRFDLCSLAPARTPCDPNTKLCKANDYKAPEEFGHKYLSMFGSLNYLPTIARPDLAYAVSLVGRYNSNPDQTHMDAVTRIYAYLLMTQNHGIHYSNSDNSLRGYVDSDYGGCSDTSKSTTGWVFMLAGGPISWSSKRQQTVSLSSTEAEYMAGTEAAKEAIWIKNFINDLDLPEYKVDAVELNVDNKSALRMSKNPEFHQRTKHIQIRHNYIRECVQDGHINVQWISGKENIADTFTKALGRPIFEKHINSMGICD